MVVEGPLQPDEEFQRQLGSWARQTIVYAMCIRLEEVGKTLNPTRLQGMKTKAEETTQWLWTETLKKTGDTAPAFSFEFTRAVLDWCHLHRNPPKKD